MIKATTKGLLWTLLAGATMIGVSAQSELTFTQIAPQGFGDLQNSAAWSMFWWKNRLYVGTNRSWLCWSAAVAHSEIPFFPYPPDDPDAPCTPDPVDLPLRAEIWRYTPSTVIWERVFQSPEDVPVPGQAGKFTSPEVGFRGMMAFTEPDGTEALYVTTTAPKGINPDTGPPRILRSTDGTNFEAIPQDPGTVLGDLDRPSLRGMAVFKDRFYVVAGGLNGSGAVLEATDPAGGNDNFRQITPDGLEVFELEVFNGFLYLGTNDRGVPRAGGYTIVKTDATGEPPYALTTVVDQGGFLPDLPARSVVSMFVFGDSLYAGTNRFPELLRIHPDDTWDLLVGTPRLTPTGWKFPLSGFDAGFDWLFNIHIWRMQAHQGVLYVGTADQSTEVFPADFRDPAVLLNDLFGFDLFRTDNGWFYTNITRSGFGDLFQMGLRSFAASPSELYVGTVDLWKGLKIWRGKALSASSAPRRLEAENRNGKVLLAWENPGKASRFHLFRASSDAGPRGPESVREIGTTRQTLFVDTATVPGKRYTYYVQAESGTGALSGPSNLAPAPSLAEVTTFQGVQNTLSDWKAHMKFRERSAAQSFGEYLARVHSLAERGDLEGALGRLEQLRPQILANKVLSKRYAVDLEILVGKLSRRVRLASAGLLSVADLG